MPNASLEYLTQAKAILDRIEATQMDTIERAAEVCAQTIAGDGLVHLFGTGHSRIFVEVASRSTQPALVCKSH